ncbi:L-serine dehydratase 1 [Mitosporidium daphniae]|uniref:L-serine dehydratase 1 n=1 Tax=Mitosporidium daphniae TaxID=1485682 RepID=A0A098VVX2_9MICR|nr:L-serine dehydratase 1 [Mitosporidium daphniae]KGG53102.1 L-serine dehydratase 1 [Mitosporidium daphniae]|eukprot:XP_013239538.1 L-serine dehydratase 1 [Mitosporidium daphniae]
MYSIGIGPSSSHTLGPMRAANKFVTKLEANGVLGALHSIFVHLYGSLALTGEGHGTPKAIAMGLIGKDPESIDPTTIPKLLKSIEECSVLHVLEKVQLSFSMQENINFHKKIFLAKHSNGLAFMAFGADGSLLAKETVFSIGGGFVISDGFQLRGKVIVDASDKPSNSKDRPQVPYPFFSGEELLTWCNDHRKTVSEIAFENERPFISSTDKIIQKTLHIWRVMEASIIAGLSRDVNSILPGVLKVKRRAPSLLLQQVNDSADAFSLALTPFLERDKNLNQIFAGVHNGPPTGMVRDIDWISTFAIAVNEENADGGRIVTAPTNGASGVIPATLKYWLEFGQHTKSSNNSGEEEMICTFLWTASAIGFLFKHGASLSAAEVGCQGEIGVASSMAAAGLAAVLGGTPKQVLNAAEIAMEHHLGMTCDPIAGLVQIPCIERNAMGAVKALTAAQLALKRDGNQKISLDQVIKTMKQTGLDMKAVYKETSLVSPSPKL